MPRYNPDPSKVAFGFAKYEKGIYRLEIGEPKAFAFKDKTDPTKETSWGVRLPAKVIASDDYPAMVGKQFNPINLFKHSEGGETYSKGVEAAILGAKNDEEWNNKYLGMDFSYNTDDGSVGDYYHLLKGKIVDVECGEPEKPKDKQGNVQEEKDTQTNVVRFRIVE